MTQKHLESLAEFADWPPQHENLFAMLQCYDAYLGKPKINEDQQRLSRNSQAAEALFQRLLQLNAARKAA